MEALVMSVEVNLLAVAGAFVASMVVGSVWYAKPVFGRTWAQLVKLDDKQMQAGAGKAFAVMMPLALLEALVLAYAAFIVHAFFGNSFLQDALTTGFWVWLGFQLTSMMVHDVFEQRARKLSLINAANQFVTVMAMALVIGLIGF
jgi:hypothetical protein